MITFLQHFFTGIDYLEISRATQDTLLMLVISIIMSAIIGIPLGIALYITSKSSVLSNQIIYNVLSFIINILRSIPFIILLIIMMPFTMFLVGTSLGVTGVIPPLIVGTFPFFTRLIENALLELDNGILDMAHSCGANTWQIIWHILLPEILPNIIATLTVTTIALISYTAMAGVVGGGGLGDLAIRYGYQRFQINVMFMTVVIMIVMVQLIQFIGNKLVLWIKNK